MATSKDGTPISYQTLGVGDGLLVLGGAWRTSDDYLPLAHALADTFTVHVIDRRGRGHSGPQGSRYSIEREVEDLLAVQIQTRSQIVLGHSYGGLVALEAARGARAFTDVIVYEPGISLAGSIPVGWMPRYAELLATGDRRGAFAAMVRQAGGAPPALKRMPLWWTRLMLRMFIKPQQWERIEPLLETALIEHEQVAALDDETAVRYHDVAARVLLLGGSKSAPRFTTDLFAQLAASIPNTATDLLDGLDHTAPDEGSPAAVAGRVKRHLRPPM